MSGCEYCERKTSLACDGCDAWVCRNHFEVVRSHFGDRVLCNPDPATHPGRGCYKPPVSEVSDDREERR